MALTLRNDAKNEIIKILRNQGYPTYARLVDFFDIYLTDDPEVIGYMIPGKAKIVLNKDLNIDQVSTIVRHEVLHEYLTHGPRQQKFDNEHPELNPQLAPHDLSNIAADFEISNKGYTAADKATIRGIKLGDKKETLRGLVTEDDHPDWVNLSYEEMYKKLLEENAEDRQEIKNLLDQIQKLSRKDIEDMIDDAESMQGGSDQNSDEESKSNKQDQGSSSDTDSGSDSDSDSDSDTSGTQDKAAKAAKAAKKLKDDADEVDKASERSEGIFDTPEEQEAKADIAARAQQIRDFINNIKEQERMNDENARAIQKEMDKRAAADTQRYMGSGLQQFKLNLNRFIATQIDDIGEPEDTYRVLDPRYEDSDFLMPGQIRRYNKQIPLINVYHDASGSFDKPEKTAAAFKAIETLNKYVRDGDIEIKVYYFANRVGPDRNNVGGGTDGTPILDHIEATRPTNVIIITDGDISDCRRVVKVPGAVWMLFYDSRSENIMEHVKGKQQNKYYDITY